MAITINEGGVLYELDGITANEGGVLYELDSVIANESGTLYEIYSWTGNLPTALTWTVDTSISGYDTQSAINDTSNNGFTINYTAKTLDNSSGRCIRSNSFYLPNGATVNIAATSISGTGTSTKVGNVALCNADGQTDFVNITVGEPAELTADSAREYYLLLGGGSFTVSNQGKTITHYTATIACTIAFAE